MSVIKDVVDYKPDLVWEDVKPTSFMWYYNDVCVMMSPIRFNTTNPSSNNYYCNDTINQLYKTPLSDKIYSFGGRLLYYKKGSYIYKIPIIPLRIYLRLLTETLT